MDKNTKRNIIIGTIVISAIFMILIIISLSSSAPLVQTNPPISLVLPPSSAPSSSASSNNITNVPVAIVPDGCSQCSTGYYLCPAGVISAPNQWYDKQAIAISSYRLPQYDPEQPNVSVGTNKYYFRKAGTTC